MSSIPPAYNLPANIVQATPGQPKDVATDTLPSSNQEGVHKQYRKLLDILSRKPAHASHAFPFEVNGYDQVSLLSNGNPWMTFNKNEKQGLFQKMSNKVSNVYQLSVDTAGNIVRDSFWGGIFGTGTGLLISALRFRWGIPEMLNRQKFLGLLMMPGLPLLGGVIGASHGFFTATRHQASKFNQAFQTLLGFN